MSPRLLPAFPEGNAAAAAELKGLTAPPRFTQPPSAASPSTQGKEKGWRQATSPLLRCSPLHRAGMAPRAWLPTDRTPSACLPVNPLPRLQQGRARTLDLGLSAEAAFF